MSIEQLAIEINVEMAKKSLKKADVAKLVGKTPQWISSLVSVDPLKKNQEKLLADLQNI